MLIYDLCARLIWSKTEEERAIRRGLLRRHEIGSLCLRCMHRHGILGVVLAVVGLGTAQGAEEPNHLVVRASNAVRCLSI